MQISEQVEQVKQAAGTFAALTELIRKRNKVGYLGKSDRDVESELVNRLKLFFVMTHQRLNEISVPPVVTKSDDNS